MAVELHEMQGRIAAVFVTMDRRETARTCLRKLYAQTVRPDAVLIVDNASSDGTAAMVEEMRSELSGLEIHCQRLETNVGNAGGMEVLLAQVFNAQYAAVWLLDDDSWPEPGALENLVRARVPRGAVRSSKVVDLTSGELSWPLQVPSENGGDWNTLEKSDPLPPGPLVLIRRAWLGALIPREVYERIGPVEGKLFLRGEDEDYPRRIEAAGFPVYLSTRSILHHPPAGRLLRIRIGSQEVVLEGGLKPDNLYYRLRNSWWMAKRDKSAFTALGLATFHFIILLKDRRYGPWLAVWAEALRDAMTNRLGKRGSTGFVSGGFRP